MGSTLTIGKADQWFDGLCLAMAGEDLDMMLCMPTIGHYLASVAHDNIVAVRTSTDYVNHQIGQLDILRKANEEYRIPNSSENNLRQNLLLSFLAGALGLAPSYDVFITNQNHPEGFAEPESVKQALVRALSAGIVGIGDKIGCVDRTIINKLAFPDGTLAQPDHPPYPVISTLQTDVTAFYSTTTVDGFRWNYVAMFNLGAAERVYSLDLRPFLDEADGLVYDYMAGEILPDNEVSGTFGPGDFRYLVIAPRVGDLYLLGLLDKYIPVSRRQFKEISRAPGAVNIALELPTGRSYTLVISGPERVLAEGRGISDIAVERQLGLTLIGFRVETPVCRLILRV